MKRRTYLRTVAGVGAGAGLGGCLRSEAGDDYDVGMSAVAFRPREYEATVGEPVVWKNTSSRGHTVTAYADGVPEGAAYFASGGFDSEQAARDAWRTGGGGTLAGSARYEHTFEVAGTYRYFCVPHESQGMVGTVVVGD